VGLLVVEATASLPATSTGLSYNSVYWTVPSGSLIMQQYSSSVVPPWIGPVYSNLQRPVEATVPMNAAAMAGMVPRSISWSNTVDWLFLTDNTGAATTRRTQLYVLNKTVGNLAYVGYVTHTMPFRSGPPNFTVYGFDVAYKTYATGSIASTGASVTGTGTSWVTSRLTAGSRIGLGATVPSSVAIGNWYNILSIASDSSLALTASASVWASGSAYVIEDLRFVWALRGSTASYGSGVFINKGAAYNDFTQITSANGGTNYGSAVTTTDNQKNIYWLSDGIAQTDTLPIGAALAPVDDWTQQYLYMLCNTTANTVTISKYNIRAALTSNFSSGSTAGCYNDGDAFVLRTAAITASGSLPAVNNGCIATAQHGSGNGVRAFYWLTTGSVYCSLDSQIVASGGGFTVYQSFESPPGGTSLYAATNLLNNIAYDSIIDRFAITTTGGGGSAPSLRSYITQYTASVAYNAASSWSHLFLTDTRLINNYVGDTVDVAVYPVPINAASSGIHTGCNRGMYYFCTLGATAATNILYAVPIALDWQYAANAYTGTLLISPALSTPNANNYNSCYVISNRIVGTDNLGQIPGGIKTYYRTSGISNNSGSWVAVSDGNNLSSVAGAAQIQFAYAFQTICPIPLPAHIYRIGVTYTDLTTDSHFMGSAGKSIPASGSFAWYFSQSFSGGTGSIPYLRVRLYDAIAGTSLLDDNTQAPAYGTWMVSTGSVVSWFSQNPLVDRTNSTTYIQYTPSSASVTSGYTVKAILTLK
jgi:hypothetical protein